MVKQDLIDRSPVRYFEKVLGGGLKAGEIGVITSKKGLGKTSVLVQIGLDMLLQGKKVIHVSFNQHSDYVISWYEDIFNEMAKKKNLDKAEEVKDELIRNRILLNFSQDVVTSHAIGRTLKALSEGGSKADALIIDGFDFSKASVEDFKAMKDLAKEMNIGIWYSGNVDGLSDAKNAVPSVLLPFKDVLDVVIFLEPKPDFIQLKVLKDRDVSVHNDIDLKLDTKTLLIAEK